MDNYVLSNRHKPHIKHETSDRWRRPIPEHRARWIESMSPEALNIFIGVHGPNRIPKLREQVHFRVQPYLEVTSRADPTTPPVVHSLGKDSALHIIGKVEFKQAVDKKRNLHKIVIFVIQNEAAQLNIEAPEGYKHKLPFYKQRVLCPLAGAKFHMYYSIPKPATEPQGVISKIYRHDTAFEQYVPQDLKS